MKPLSPDEVKNSGFPDSIIKIVNDAIKKNFKRGKAILYQDSLAATVSCFLGISVINIFDNGYMDFEQLYRDQGWNVKYESPDRDETWKAHFVFKKKEEK